MSHIFRHQPANTALNNLEEVSVLMKHQNQANFKIDDFTQTSVSREYAKPGDAAMKSASEGLINGTKDYFKVSGFQNE